MLKRIGFWLAFCIAFGQGGILLADVVSRADARVAAANWTRDEAFSSERPNGSPSDVQTVMSDGREIVHVVSFGDGGWVVTSTDDRLEPVLAFSKSGSVETLLATPFVDILTADLRSRRIAEGLATTDDQEAGVAPAVKSADELLSPCQMKWRRLLHPTPADLQATTSNGRTNLSNVVVAPLIKTKWSQGSIGSMPCFNYYTPDHLQSGCVATAMAQLMRYHRYPVLPVESRPYPCKLYGQDIELTLMGGCYDWDAMVDEPQKTLSETVYQAIGKLMYDCGVALGNEYKTYSTSAYTKNIVPALLETFGYYSAKRLDLRDEASLNLFNSLATNDLARARPVVVSLHGANSGHSILIDGYGFSGQSTVTVSTAGKISGKMLAQGKTWKISAASFSDESEEGTFHATITATCGKETLTDELTLRADELGGCLNGACLCAVQNNWKVEPWKSAAAKIAKKPKLTIPVDGVLTGEVVLSFGTAGTVKAAGCFVTGVDAKGRSQTVKVSCSSVLSPLTAASPETGSCVAETVIYFPAKGTFPGWVQRLVIEL